VFFPLAGPILAADLLGSDITSATLSCFLGWCERKPIRILEKVLR